MKAKQKCVSFISWAACLRYRVSSATVPLSPSAKGRGSGDRAQRKAAGLVAGIDVGHVGDAVARHVVMIERLAELFRTGRSLS